MTASAKLVTALSSVDWNANIEIFCGDELATQTLGAPSLRLAVWSRQFEQIERNNPAICFIREMQVAGHLVAITTGLAIYKAAAASMRTIVESALYYSYFRTHPVELATLVRDDKWYVSKSEIIDFHTTHTKNFSDYQKKLNFVGALTPWYSKISQIIHGQLPGTWTQKSISETKHSTPLYKEVISQFIQCVDLVNSLFLCTAGRELWDNFSPTAKKEIIRGMPGELKSALRLDAG